MRVPAFFVGTGHTLNRYDLDAIIGQFSVSCNQIHHIFPQTLWRLSVLVMYGGFGAEVLALHLNKEYDLVLREHLHGVFDIYSKQYPNVAYVGYCPPVPHENSQWCSESRYCFQQGVAEPFGVGAQIIWEQDVDYDPLYLLGCDMSGPHFYDRTEVKGQDDLSAAYTELLRQADLRGRTVINLSKEEHIDWNSILRK